MFPPEFIRAMKRQLGEAYSEFETALRQPSPVSIRYNRRKQNPATTGFQQSVAWCPQGRYLPERPIFTLDPLLHAGAYYVQEASSMFVAEAVRQTVALEKPLLVADLCAAPGGKTTLLADLLNDGSLMVANEVIKSRVNILKENWVKWGAANGVIANHDTEDFLPLRGFFDIVLTDAPCSGEGLFRKDEGAIGEWSAEQVVACAGRQKRILANAVPLVKAGGVLIYSTCTYNEAENRENCAWLLENFDLEGVQLHLDETWGIVELPVIGGGFGYQFYPHRVKGEGFFISIFRKKNEENFNLYSKKTKQKGEKNTNFQKIPTKELGIFSEFIKDVSEFDFFLKPNDEVFIQRKNLSETYEWLDKTLTRKALGLEIGTLKKRNFVPSHDLAMNPAVVTSTIPTVELTLEDALLYLKKESINPEMKVKGWTLATYQGLPLGWGKALGNRFNNYYPSNWRIRMNL